MNFKVKTQITTPVLKLEMDRDYYVYPVAPFFTGKEVDGKEAPMVLKVIDMTSGQLADVIPGQVAVQELLKAYPGHSYVGRGFAIKKRAIEGKKYRAVDLAEVEIPADLLPKLKAAADKASKTSPAAQEAPAEGAKAKVKG